jgi:hypothetical protein
VASAGRLATTVYLASTHLQKIRTSYRCAGGASGRMLIRIPPNGMFPVVLATLIQNEELCHDDFPHK